MIILDAGLLIVSFIFGANNIGVIRSAFQQVSGRASSLYIGIGSAMFALGFLIEGYKVQSTLTKGLAEISFSASAAALTTMMLMMLLFTALKFPASISNITLGAVLGASVKEGVAIHSDLVFSIVGAWLIAPLSAAIFALMLHRVYIYVARSISFKSVAMLSRVLAIVTVGITSYTLGANNLGILLGFSSGPIASDGALFAALIGGILFSGSVAWLLGWKMSTLSPSSYSSALAAASITLWIYTQFGIPTSMTQSIVGAMVILSLMQKPSIINSKVIYEVLGSWPILLSLSFALSFVLNFII